MINEIIGANSTRVNVNVKKRHRPLQDISKVFERYPFLKQLA